MNKIFLTETAKKLLLYLNDLGDKTIDYLQPDIDTRVALKQLERVGYISMTECDNYIYYAVHIKDLGREYIQLNPTLENPVNENLTKQNLEMQNEDLAHKKTQRPMIVIIGYSTIAAAIAGVLGYIIHLLAIPFK